MESTERAHTLETVTDGAILTVNPDRIIAEVTAQACHERGLAQVVRDLLDFDRDELYLHEFPELVGSTYAEAQQSFEKAALLGIGGGDGIVLNPSPGRVVEAGERILALVEDDSTFISSGVRPVPQVAVGDEPDPEPPLRILVSGGASSPPRSSGSSTSSSLPDPGSPWWSIRRSPDRRTPRPTSGWPTRRWRCRRSPADPNS